MEEMKNEQVTFGMLDWIGWNVKICAAKYPAVFTYYAWLEVQAWEFGETLPAGRNLRQIANIIHWLS